MMTRFYNRQVQVVIDGGRGLIELNPELAVRFNVRKTRANTPNQFDIDLINLNTASKTALKQAGAKVLLKAGYTPEAGVLAVGDVVRAATSWQGADSITKVQLLDGLNALQNTNVSLSFPEGATVGEVTAVIAGQMGAPLKVGNTVAQSNRFATGYAYVGKVAGALTEVARRGNARWTIQNGVLQLMGRGDKANAVLELASDSGLLARIEEIESSVVSDRVLPARLPVKGYVLTCLLLPTLNPHDWVKVKSRDLVGEFIVDEVYHEGGNREANMTTRLTVYER